MSALAAYGVNLTPPAPISYNVGTTGGIAGIIAQANQANTAANAANNQRYTQELGVLGNAAQGQQAQYGNALNDIIGNYGNAVNSLNGSLANDQTVFQNEQNRVGQQAQQASSAAQQSAISRGLGNSTITNSLQDQVTRSANDAYANVAASKAQADNGVYQNLANLYQNEGQAAAGINEGAGNAYMQGGSTIANAIQGRTDQAPSLSEYAQLIQSASAAQNSQGRTNIQTTVPDTSPIAQRINGGTTGGVAASTGQGYSATGGYSSSGGGAGAGAGGSIAGAIGSGTGSSGGGGAPGSVITGGGNTDTSVSSGSLSSLPGSGTPQGFQPTQAGTPGETGQQGGDSNYVKYAYGNNGYIAAMRADGSWTVINPGTGGQGGVA